MTNLILGGQAWAVPMDFTLNTVFENTGCIIGHRRLLLTMLGFDQLGKHFLNLALAAAHLLLDLLYYTLLERC